MIKDLLRRLAWRLLQKDIDRLYVRKSEIATYTRWMCPYFPITEDAEEYLLSGADRIQRHREEMIKKHLGGNS